MSFATAREIKCFPENDDYFYCDEFPAILIKHISLHMLFVHLLINNSVNENKNIVAEKKSKPIE